MNILENIPHFIFLLLFASLIMACEDGGVDPGPDPVLDTFGTVTQNWGVDDVVVDDTSQGSQNVTVDFEEGGQYTLRIPTLDRLGTSGSWRFSNDQTVIILNDGSQEVIAEIVSISEEQMILEFDFENYKGDVTTYRITLSS